MLTVSANNQPVHVTPAPRFRWDRMHSLENVDSMGIYVCEKSNEKYAISNDPLPHIYRLKYRNNNTIMILSVLTLSLQTIRNV